MHKKLFIPGPVEVSQDVLEKMATPMIGHRSKDASALQRRISDKLRIVFQTKEEILLSTTSGSGLMEGAIRCCTAKRAAVFSIGAFGKRWYEMALNNNDYSKPYCSSQSLRGGFTKYTYRLSLTVDSLKNVPCYYSLHRFL